MNTKQETGADSEHEESRAEQRCRRCGEWIKRGRAVWVAGRPYGMDCAKKELAKQDHESSSDSELGGYATKAESDVAKKQCVDNTDGGCLDR